MSDHDPGAPPPEPGTGGVAPTVAIDGPAGSGKSTAAAGVAGALGIPHIDTGAMYRAVTLACLRAGADLDDAGACAEVAARVRIDRDDGRTLLDGEDVEEEIRTGQVTAGVSTVAAHPGVREAITPQQRRLATEHGGVVEGRDVGTVVLPDADLKVFLTASVQERARRRAGQLDADDLDELTAELERRDRQDRERDVAPLTRAPDAWELDTTDMDVDEVVDAIVRRLQAVLDDPVATHRRLPRVAVVGRPNVGKSTLVNRILGERIAIVEPGPGVTRDRTEHLARWNGRDFVIVDTGGWEHDAEGLAARVVEQAERAVEQADVALLVTDVTAGLLAGDDRYAGVLRRTGTPVLVVGNKADDLDKELMVHELHELGLGEPHAVSAIHGRGVGDLLDAVVDALPRRPGLPDRPAGAPGEVPPGGAAVPRVAVVGRPNVGKSALFNRLLGDERAIVDPEAHTTRDAVDTVVELDGRPWVFVDTAGMRKRYRRGEDTELYSVDRTRRAVDEADLALFVVDASEPLGRQDQRLAAMLRDAGCGIVLTCNKWDLVTDDSRRRFERDLDRMLRFVPWVPRINVSALTGRGVRRLVPTLRGVWESYTRRIPTRQLNDSIAELTHQQPPPADGERSVRIRYATQPATRPPTVVVFASGRVEEGYRRYLERGLRERYEFLGSPLRVVSRQQ